MSEQIPVSPRRGVSRLETFTDAAFAFAAAMLAISVGEIPENYLQLVDALKNAPAFAASLAVLLLFWRAHQTWSDRYGLEDFTSVVLTFGLIFLIMVYVYPLRILFELFFSLVSDGWLPHNFQLETAFEIRVFFTVYGVGFTALGLIVAALYGHVWRLRKRLGLAADESAYAGCEAVSWLVTACIGLSSVPIYWLVPMDWLTFAPFIYFLLLITWPLSDRWRESRVRTAGQA